MPEGDTIHKVARVLAPLLVGREVLQVRLARGVVDRLGGRNVTGVQALGKHLLIRFDNALTLRSHLGMHGSWHRYDPDEPWRKPARQAVVVLTTASDVLVCFNAREVEVLRSGGIAGRELERRLGPDLAAAAFAPGPIPARARALLSADTPVVDLLLDQRVAAGVGNVYKSEVLFLERQPPGRTLGSLSDEAVAALYARAHALLRANLSGGPRVTRTAPGPDLWVYGRRGQPCLHCGAPVSYARLGRGLRPTYWCPSCQADSP